jgi:four helix bundle protein
MKVPLATPQQPGLRGADDRSMLGSQRLDVYRSATGFLEAAWTLAERVPRDDRGLSDRLRRAALTIALDIAAGSDGRAYRLACDSALECASVIEALEALQAISTEDAAGASRLLERLVAILGRLACGGAE